VSGYARGNPASSRDMLVWLRWCWSNFEASDAGVEEDDTRLLVSPVCGDRECKTLVIDTTEELAGVCLTSMRF
jgi:hypothetical protein